MSGLGGVNGQGGGSFVGPILRQSLYCVIFMRCD